VATRARHAARAGDGEVMHRLVVLAMFAMACRDDHARIQSWLNAWDVIRGCLVPVEYGADPQTAFRFGAMLGDTSSCVMKLKHLAADAPSSVPPAVLEALSALEGGDGNALARVDVALARLRQEMAMAPVARSSLRPVRTLPPGQQIDVEGAALGIALTRFVLDHVEGSALRARRAMRSSRIPRGHGPRASPMVRSRSSNKTVAAHVFVSPAHAQRWRLPPWTTARAVPFFSDGSGIRT
jgi:hypothetical protein